MPNSTSLSKTIQKRLAARRLFYVCRDVERAIGISLSTQNYFIITNYNEFSAKLAEQYPNIILIKEKEQLDTKNLLIHVRTKNTIKKNDFVVVFKSNTLIEAECKKNGWKLLNPDSKLADRIEGKVSQVKWLGSLAKFLPPHKITTCGQIKWNKKPFVVQFNHSHTGSGVVMLNSKKKLDELKTKFANREVRTMNFIKGPVFTNNNVVWGNKVLAGNISYQITGLSPFTANKFATIGNDWALPRKTLSKTQILQYKKIVTAVGKKLGRDGWKGLYGVDVIMNEKTKRLYLLEINARQPASTTFESQLQMSVIPTTKEESLSGLKLKRDLSSPLKDSLGMTKLTTVFEAHLASLLGIKPDKYKLAEIHDGAQITQKVTGQITKAQLPKISNPSIINQINYNNDSLESDLFRIQCYVSVMQNYKSLNKLGKEIRSAMLAIKK